MTRAGAKGARKGKKAPPNEAPAAEATAPVEPLTPGLNPDLEKPAAPAPRRTKKGAEIVLEGDLVDFAFTVCPDGGHKPARFLTLASDDKDLWSCRLAPSCPDPRPLLHRRVRVTAREQDDHDGRLRVVAVEDAGGEPA